MKQVSFFLPPPPDLSLSLSFRLSLSLSLSLKCRLDRFVVLETAERFELGTAGSVFAVVLAGVRRRGVVQVPVKVRRGVPSNGPAVLTVSIAISLTATTGPLCGKTSLRQ